MTDAERYIRAVIGDAARDQGQDASPREISDARRLAEAILWLSNRVAARTRERDCWRETARILAEERGDVLRCAGGHDYYGEHGYLLDARGQLWCPFCSHAARLAEMRHECDPEREDA